MPDQSPPKLPADLAKLRQRFVAAFPAEATRADRLARVPIAFRHLLALRLELHRAASSPNRFRPLVDDAAPDAAGVPAGGDAVDRLVARYAAALRRPAVAASMVPALRRYFTDTQLTELTLSLLLMEAMNLFDAVAAASGEALTID